MLQVGCTEDSPQLDASQNQLAHYSISPHESHKPDYKECAFPVRELRGAPWFWEASLLLFSTWSVFTRRWVGTPHAPGLDSPPPTPSKTALGAGHKTLPPKSILSTDHHFLGGILHVLHPAWQGRRRHAQTSLRGPEVQLCASQHHPPNPPLRKGAPKTHGCRFSARKRLDNLLTSLRFTSEIQPRKAEKTGSSAKSTPTYL